MLELTDIQKETLKAVNEKSNKPMHNHSLTVLLENQLIEFVAKGNGWQITEKGKKAL